MDRYRDDQLKEIIQKELAQIQWTEQDEDRVLTSIHRQIHKRSHMRTISKKHITLFIAVAIVIAGTITAIAAGKITGFSSRINTDDAILSIKDLEQQASRQWDWNITIPDQLSDSYGFTKGYITTVDGRDENGSIITSYPTVSISYGTDSIITLDLTRPEDAPPEFPFTPDLREEYNGIQFSAKEDNYLFLPPGCSPSEADLKLQQEGKLFIGQGSPKEERKTIRTITWTTPSASCQLITAGPESLETLLAMSRQITDTTH